MRRVAVPSLLVELLREIGGIARQQGTSAYAVGGCVRDWLLGIQDTPDIDVTVEGDGIQVAHVIAGELRGMLAVHPQFGTSTITLHRPLRRLDVATCRKETYARPAAYPTVVPGALEDDLRRRDFTINAMAMTLAPERFGALIDPFGGGRDVEQRRLRILHGRSFLDDPSRILRGVRFAQRFGFHWEAETERALHEAVGSGGLGWLNAGRIQKELERMCDEPNPSACFNQLAELLTAAKPSR